ncbi:cupin domain-containing protein [Shewanella cyperi]|uniref:Cupin domain-containing protein n=2 Tax=Shewanella TaxID=22 RepID=A0A974XLY0_9GAMM|nr:MULTISPECIES: cupin domain-containing protein [Shewanella]QSX29698.1 cupin domain-containing protein [Shewanella cyperi]QSX36871.1 cupin domain-containing protein [Shewanella sedimentimangrovi]
MKPLINLNELSESFHDERGKYADTYYPISEKIGAKRLGYSLSEVPPGKRVCPFHNHRINEEMFLILAGTGTLRFGAEEYQVKPMDIIACPPGGRDVAHQLINTGTETLRYLCLSTNDPFDICEYPDSDKILAMTGEQGNRTLRHISRAGDAVDYYDGEMDD